MPGVCYTVLRYGKLNLRNGHDKAPDFCNYHNSGPHPPSYLISETETSCLLGPTEYVPLEDSDTFSLPKVLF
jgi:hypothetical protein